MYILVAISILCFSALLLVTIAIARHVRARRLPAGAQLDFAQHLFAAAEDQDSLKPRPVRQQNLKEVVATTSALQPTLANTRNQSISSKRL
jgi:hypothetical protein